MDRKKWIKIREGFWVTLLVLCGLLVMGALAYVRWRLTWGRIH